ncbi:MAG: hypothetical protein EGP09_00140, partial [SAR202 cluster bacterium]
NGIFISLDDFCKRMDSSWINKKILESLIKSGSFDEFGDRGSLFDSVERILLQINNATKLRNSNQTTMFDLFGDEVETPTTDLELTNIKTEDTQKMHWEKEILGISFTENPNHKEMLRIKEINEDMVVSMNQLDNVDQKKPQTIIAEVRSYEKRVSRKGSEFMIVKLELIDGVIDLMVWQNKLEDVDKWLHSPIAKISGKINNRNGDASIWYDNGEIFSFDEEIIPKKTTQENLIKSEPIITIEDKQKEEKTIIEEFAKEDLNYIKEVIITLDDQKHSQNKHLMDDITRILLDNEGQIPVSIVVKNNNEKVKLSLPFANVDASKSLEEKLDNIIGLENVYYKQ